MDMMGMREKKTKYIYTKKQGKNLPFGCLIPYVLIGCWFQCG